MRTVTWLIVDGRSVITGSFHFARAADVKNAENLLWRPNPPELEESGVRLAYRLKFLLLRLKNSLASMTERANSRHVPLPMVEPDRDPAGPSGGADRGCPNRPRVINALHAALL
jgi:hypothetical protein